MRTAFAIVACSAFAITGLLDLVGGQFQVGVAELLISGANFIFLLLLS